MPPAHLLRALALAALSAGALARFAPGEMVRLTPAFRAASFSAGRCEPDELIMLGLIGKVYADDGGFSLPFSVECNS